MEPMPQDRIAELENRVAHIISLALDAMERQLTPPPAPVMPHATDDEEALAARRFLSDQLALYVMCDRAACQRARHCCGRHALCYLLHMDMVPPDVVSGVKAWTDARLAGIDPHTLRGEPARHIAAFVNWRRRFGLSALPTVAKRKQV